MLRSAVQRFPACFSGMGRDVRLSREFRRSRRYKEATAELGERVRWLRKDKRWTLEKASEKMGLDFRHLQQIEAGSVNVTLATILRICDAFDVSPFVILPGVRSPKLKLGADRDPKLKSDQALWVGAIRAAEPSRKPQAGLLLENPIERPPLPELTDVKKRVGTAIKRLRELRGLTQEKLAKTMTMSVKYLQAVEGGKQNLSIVSLVKFARVLEVDPMKLFVREE